MSFLDKLKGQASDLKSKASEVLGQNSDKISSGLDKAGAYVDNKTQGKYTDKIEKGKIKAREGLEKLDDKGGDAKDGPAPR